MENKRDYYEILGISRSAEPGEIKKAYRKLAKKYHPDSNAGNAQAEQKFKEITEAYTILSDPEKRKLYDQFGHAAFDGSAGAYGRDGFSGSYSGGYSDPHSGYQEFHFEGGDVDDILKNIFGGSFGGKFRQGGRTSGAGGFGGNSGFGGSSRFGGGSGFGGAGGFGGSGFHSGGFDGRSFYGGNYQQKGQDLRAEATISFDDSVFGCDKLLNLSGENGVSQTLKVHIPAGIEDGKSIRLRGKGGAGIHGGESGDLLLKIHVTPKPGFERKGQDVYTTVSVPFITAALGGEVKVHTLYGDVLCKIREGTQSGSKIRLKGKGIRAVGSSGTCGDQYATVQIQVPRNLSQESRRKLQEYEESVRRSAQSGKTGTYGR